MKSKILMYLFIFSILITLFIYMNDKRILDSQEEKIEILEQKLADAEANQAAEVNSSSSEVYFNLKDNDDAISYFEDRGISASEIPAKIEDILISANSATEDNPYVTYDGMEGNTRINKIQVLNHKWVMADFTDGVYWGEVFYIYDVKDDGSIELYPETSFIYPRD